MSAAYTNLKQQLHDYVYNKIPLKNLREHLQNVSRAEIYELTETERSSRGCTVLHYAAYINDLATTESILDSFSPTERGELLRIQDESGATPIHLAALTGRTRSVQYMLSSVVREEIFPLLQIQDEGNNTAIHCAVLKGNTETAGNMLTTLTPDEVFELMVVPGGFGRTTLHEAALNDHTETIKCILELVSPEKWLDLLYIYVGDVRSTLDQLCSNPETAEFIRQYWKTTKGCSLEICALQVGLKDKEQTIQRQKDVIAELTGEKEIEVAARRKLEGELQEKDNLLQQKDNLLQQKDNLLQQKEAQITDLKAQVVKAEGQNEELRKVKAQVAQLKRDLQGKADKPQWTEIAGNPPCHPKQETNHGKHSDG